ncbi:hypothetical protein LEP1GSC034_0319 [Leptospira interrogans str. 2003000735]|uniref:Uncharacterized protein n=2 Tax=Leptospira interrogans TaxID=173 RepID=A0A829D695_LEPIR|nr:hypothetical protein LEP1GSC027_2735 [Leptospira interrogans str. 2002000624]EKQ39380.1 hypothetical protein LEP1GSC025_1659 [Leptospira interrogans str. 2002000621]EKQ45558.1 hypothetical protein LEP1GSC026_1881 [Leptospira interrogans str. 2002000623]EMJ52559.1 hypothetical protein LEP1GSC013_3028 [Leptospira interrogans serovar Valbuzzi str. Duyster]EMJ66540.1 hypothetical protein LEP1GSC034_0319 [Leptospira interrogans str. 2003000735]EMJ74792.1 hypothetical protein LEP1GSC033_4594 [Lep
MSCCGFCKVYTLNFSEIIGRNFIWKKFLLYPLGFGIFYGFIKIYRWFVKSEVMLV